MRTKKKKKKKKNLLAVVPVLLDPGQSAPELGQVGHGELADPAFEVREGLLENGGVVGEVGVLAEHAFYLFERERLRLFRDPAGGVPVAPLEPDGAQALVDRGARLVKPRLAGGVQDNHGLHLAVPGRVAATILALAVVQGHLVDVERVRRALVVARGVVVEGVVVEPRQLALLGQPLRQTHVPDRLKIVEDMVLYVRWIVQLRHYFVILC